MFNEALFIAQTICVTAGVIFFAHKGKEALVAYIGLLFVMANIFVIKQINLFGLAVTSADAFIVAISMSCNLMQELYDKNSARQAVSISFYICLMYLLIAKIIVFFQPSTPQDGIQMCLETLTAHSTRITAASLIAYFITQTLDIKIYSILKKKTHNHFFMVRNYISIILSQLTDTLLFSFLGLYGIVDNVWDVILFSFVIKLVAVATATPALFVAQKYLKKVEKK